MRNDRRKRSHGRLHLLLAASVLAAFCWGVGNSAEIGGDAADRMLIDCGSLETRLGNDNLRVLDIRPEMEHRSGHIPGALAVPLGEWKQLAQQPGALHDAKAWSEKIGALGVANDSEVVVYGGPLSEAARLWWMLTYFGLEHVRLLDGDWNTWTREGRPVETEAAGVRPAKFVPNLQDERLAEIDQVKQWLDDATVQILDSRTRGEYTGEAGPPGNPRGGHLPGVLHFNWESLRAEDGRFKPPKELRAQYEALGVKRDRTVVTYCQSGGRAAAQAFALELAGFGKARNYYCSFGQWSSDEEAPLVEGE
ncbi:MAG: sulfurtransferase [Planctomycetota bacterium]